MEMGLFSFLTFFVFCSVATAQVPPPTESLITRAKNEKWAEHLQWHRLIQYEKNLLGGYKSSAEPGPFFLSPQGQKNPESELLATLAAFSDEKVLVSSQDSKYKEPAACVFPARKIWIEKISGHKFASPACERYERFIEILAPKSLTYVFSSYYLNNPASAFGHTFLRINKAPSARDGERYELSDYGVGYAAMKVSDNPLVYSFLGLSGLMPGTFDINPYYYKVREYNDFESRDLWEYDLDFNPEEVQMVVAYIWELLGAHFNYHYMSENCAYRILSIFEVARPSLDLTSKQKAQVMPADTVGTLNQVPGLITKIHYRPSVRALFETRYQTLNSEEKKRLYKFSRSNNLADLKDGLSKDEQRHTLDAAMDFLDYRYPKEILMKTGKFHLKKQVLAERAEVGGITPTLKVPEPWSEAPHDAQGSRRWGLGGREWNNQKYYLLDMKLALHDLLDPKIGYPPTAEMTMGSFSASYNLDNHEVALDRALIYEVVSLSPVNDFNDSPSWRLKVSVERGYENNCAGLCRWTEISGGSGMTRTFFGHLDLAIWLRATGMTSPDFAIETWRVGAGPSVMARWNHGKFSFLAESYYRYDYKGVDTEFRQNSVGVNLSLNKSFSIRLQGEDVQNTQRLDGKIFWYY
ncbi:hypothetical protein AZI86_02160 [Bdellovibrio bacteriovorus]|uniref:Uncharacterized protein n=1 Tax=Bdellovibrio bacteriovorus TaxID=959 RepID=A0A150WNB8_BDEBC|nr:DUF4105 domain-containing protein [Bdellovibrio bacteriovorus]KYG65900.1 hypothetical protein AZI86_02160 [Bdellovibrio bacteriovorus]